jgi:putative transcriptional regulator
MCRIFTIIAWLLVACSVMAEPSTEPGTDPTTQPEAAAGHFLVARRNLHGPYFSRTVIYLLQHDEHGTVGLVVNRPLGKRVADMLPDTHSFEIGAYPVYNGGPVSPHIMVMLFRGVYHTDKALLVSDGVYASSNLAMLGEMLMAHKPDNELRMFAGQANWQPGQLQQELESHAWYVTAGDPALLFEGDVDHLWQRLINQIDPVGIVAVN